MLKITAIACIVTLCAFTMSSSLAQDKPTSAPPATTDKPATPAQAVPPTIEQGQALLQAEEFGQAAELFHRIVKADPDNARAWHLMGYSLHAAGNLTDALPCHLMASEFEEMAPVSSYNAACVYALRKKADKAFAWLDKAKAAGFDNIEQIEGDSDMDNIRSDPRFAKFVESLKGGEPAPDTGPLQTLIQPGSNMP